MKKEILHYLDKSDLYSKQVLFAMASTLDSTKGELFALEKRDRHWKLFKEHVPVVFGKEGLALGHGCLFDLPLAITPKKEGDQKSPIGAFLLTKSFGHISKNAFPELNFPYEELTPFHEAVDDPQSKLYNRIVDLRTGIAKDWSSSEKMGHEPLYELGIEIAHNYHPPKPGKGSAIFLHTWRGPNEGTAGCTALNKKDLEEIIFWLNEASSPILIQMTKEIFNTLHPL